MAKVIYNTAVSLDGYIADSENSLEWLFAVDNDSAPDIEAFQNGIGVLVSGSTTYEWVLKAENLIDQPEKWADLFGDRPWFVFTSRELSIPDGADVRLLNGTPEEFFDQIVQAAGNLDVWIFGGGDLVGQFFDAGLLSQVQLTFAPVALGSGAPVLPRRIEASKLRLDSLERFGQFAHLTYTVT